jgi:MFS transporter, FSR family, fosmidomycin resistance protein
VADQVTPVPVDGRPLGVVSSAHFMVDAYSNMYAPLLPLLMPRLGMSLQAAGTLMMVYQGAASLSQLGFGRMADRGHARALLVAGPLVSAVVLSLMGLVTHQAMLALVLVVGGLGVAAFHPPGAMVAHTAGRTRPGTAMSVFVTSGTIGFAIAPLLVANAAGRYGLGATLWFLLPGLACGLLFARAVPALPLAPHRPHGGGLRALRPQARNLFLLYTLVVLRTVVSLSFATFVPVLLTRQGMGVGEAGSAMALYLFMSGIGGFWGGTLADRFGPRRVITVSLLLSTPFLLAAPQCRDRVVADDGRGLGHRRHARAGHRHARRRDRTPDHPHVARGLAPDRRGTVHAAALGAPTAHARGAGRGERRGRRPFSRRRMKVGAPL